MMGNCCKRTYQQSVKKLGIVLASMLLSTMAHGAPFLVSDPDPTGAADQCVYQEGSNTPVSSPIVVTPPALTGNCHIDLASFAAGTHSLQVSFKSTLWGVSSQPVPFALQKPAAGGTGPANLRISQ